MKTTPRSSSNVRGQGTTDVSAQDLNKTPKSQVASESRSRRERTPHKKLTDIEPPPNATPHKSSQINADLNVSVRAQDKFSTFLDLAAKKNVRLLSVPRNGFRSYEGLCNFSNVRMIDLRDNPVEFSLISVLVAFRSLNLKTVNGVEVTEEDYNAAFQYSAVVTHALRKGMSPNISDDPEEALLEAIAFLTKEEREQAEKLRTTAKEKDRTTKRLKEESIRRIEERRSKIFSQSRGEQPERSERTEEFIEEEDQFDDDIEVNYHVDEDNIIRIDANAEIYSWYVMDDEFNWKPIAGEDESLFNPLNSPVKCVLKNVYKQTGKGQTERTAACISVIIPERDRKYHVYGELTGNAVEGGILYVKAPLSASIEWKHADDEEIIESGTLILPIKPDSVGRIIVCDIIPKVGNSMTRLFTTTVKPGEFRFKSLRLQGQLIENDEIEFEISTKGTKATFKGIRVLRSARHGEWENIDFISAEQGEGTNQLKYRLTVQDIGCVIRAVCITEGGGPPLMLTSSERVQPSAPHFVSANIYGSMKVGMPLFAIAQYEGGIQGNCRYEWSIGGSKGRPVVVPTVADVGKNVACIMTPIRSDGSIGKAVIVEAPNPIERAEKPMTERFLKFHKKTRSGKLQMSFIDRPESDQLFVVHEGETIIISTACDWAVVDSQGIHPMANSKTFTAEAGHVKGIIVIFNEDFFALVGQIEAAQPTAADVSITCDKNSAFLTVQYQYYGGVEGRSIVQWNRNDGGKTETVAAFGRSFHLSLADRGCTYRAIVTPVSLEGKRGTPTSSEPFLVEDDCVTFDERPTVELIEPEAVLEDVPIEVRIVEPGTEIVEEQPISIVQLTAKPTKRQIIVWKCKNKVISKGQMTYTPTKDDIGKVFTVQLCDRIRDTVVCECRLPAVEAQDPRVTNVRLAIEEIPGTRKRRVTVYADYYGGIEGNSVMIWLAQTPEDDKPKEVARTNQKWVEIDESFEGAMIGVIYVPMSTTQEAPGHKVESEMILIPTTAKSAPSITIESATIVPNAEYTALTCVVKTRGKGKLSYNWGYDVEDGHQFTDEYEKVHQITEDDFDYPLFCHVQPIAEDGTLGDEAFVYVDPPIEKLFTPTIADAKIEPCVKNADPELTQGQELQVTLDYHGPPIQSKIVRWQREIGKDQWKTLVDAETYTTSINDVESNIRAIVAVQAISELLSEPVSSMEFITREVFISKTNPTIKRLASTMVRTGRAQFDAALPMGEPVSVCIENGQFLIKSGSNTLMKSPVAGVGVEALDNMRCTAAIMARHGYNTELTFKDKKMKGGMKFNAEQTRDLFVVTMKSFAGKVK